MTFPVFAGSNPSGYNLSRSLRFRSSASAYLSRTPASSGSLTTMTWSYWVKLGLANIGTDWDMFSAGASDGASIRLQATNNKLRVYDYNGSAFSVNLITTQVFRDPSAWYHVVIAIDTTQATSSNRAKLYINGSQVTAFDTAVYPSLNQSMYRFNSNVIHNIGRQSQTASQYFDGYLTEVNFIDGQALTPSSFGSTNTLTGVWQPARYVGTYGTNGFYLPFTDNSGITNSSTGNNGIGKDFSGNGNYWTTNNLSLYGGTVSSFTSVGTTTWTAPTGITSVQYLVVGGGGGGGSFGGGGGGGGVVAGTLTVTPGTSYTVTVGAGGAGGAGTGYNVGTQGSNSVFASVTAIGGGAGSSQGANAGSGGSGGGGAGTGSTTTGGAGTAGQGFAGGSGDGASSGAFPAGGGGGAGEAGKNFSGNTGGIGGAGRSSSISGSLVTYGGGGGGGANSAGGNTGVGGAGGAGGGGAGSASSAGTAGTANTGGGGGGGGNITAGGAGGSGIVILAYGSSVTYDSMTDVPTLTSATAANYCTLNQLTKYSNASAYLLEASLTYYWATTASFSSVGGTIGVSSGKYYWECTVSNINSGIGSDAYIGISSIDRVSYYIGNTVYVGQGSNDYGYYSANGQKYNNGSGASYGATLADNDVVGVALDLTAGTLTFYKNNVSQGTAFTGLSGTFTPAVTSRSGVVYTNFGQRPFTYTPPTGYVALNTYNLPTSTIVKGNTVMDATLWTGNSTGSTTQTITNAGGFKPDFLWGKSRSAAYNHVLIDSVRGVTKLLYSDLTNAEVTNANALSSFNSNGFTVGTDAGGLNDSGKTFVGWQWQAGQGTTSSNTNGTITSTVSVNASAGFSVVTFTMPSSGVSTVGHGLGVAPSMVVLKSRANSSGWVTYHVSTGNGGYLLLNGTAATTTDANAFNNTSPTSSVFTVGTSFNGLSGTYVAYCWTPIAGYSAFGSYTGNGSATGPFVYTGFQPRYLMVKRSDSTANWFIWDTARNPYNIAPAGVLFADSSAAEYATSNGYSFGVVSNGFYLPVSTAGINGSGGTFIYAAFATSPFKNSLAF